MLVCWVWGETKKTQTGSKYGKASIKKPFEIRIYGIAHTAVTYRGNKLGKNEFVSLYMDVCLRDRDGVGTGSYRSPNKGA